MKAYSYHPITNEYTGEVNCQPNPVDGGFLLPGHATYEEPPLVGMKQVAVWTGKWEIKADHRGEVYWDITTKEEIVITEIGTVKDDNWTELEPISDRCIWEVDKWIDVPLTVEELATIQEAKDRADYIEAMPDLVKSMEIEIKSLKNKVATLETAKEITK